MKTSISNMIILMLSMVLASGCAKKRPDRASVFGGLRNGETVTIDSIDDKWLSFKAESFQDSGENFGAETVEIADDVDFINDLPYVNFETESELLGDDLRIKAKVGADYKIWHKLDGKFLKIYLVGQKLDIPFEAWTYSKTLEDGRLAMPLVGYPVTYVRLLNAENAQGKKTSFVSEDSLLKPEDFHKATHVSPAWSSRTPFVSESKKDAFPMDLFFDSESGEAKSWMFSGYHEISGYRPGSSYILTNYQRSALRGGQNARMAFIPQVEMVRRSDGLFLNSDYGHSHTFVERASEEYKELDASFVGKIPVTKYSSFRTVTDAVGETLTEEAVNTNASSFQNADFAFFNFKGFETYSKVSTDAVLEKLIIEKNMVSWVLKEESRKIRFNLLKKEASEKIWGESFPARESFKSDKAYFNLITFGRDVAFDDVTQRYILESDVDGYVSRYAHGINVEIRPTGALANEPWVKDVLKRATDIYNKLYEKAYEGYTVDEFGNEVKPPRFSYSSTPVDFGDPRFLKVNFSSLLYTGSGGWSAPFTQPTNGQIVGGSNYVVAAADLGYQQSFVLSYVEGVLGKGSGTVIVNPGLRGDFIEIPEAESINSSVPGILNNDKFEFNVGIIDKRLNYVLANMGNFDFQAREKNENTMELSLPSFSTPHIGVMPTISSSAGIVSSGGFTFNYDSNFLSQAGYGSSSDLLHSNFDDFYSQIKLTAQAENNGSLNFGIDQLAYAELNNPYKDFAPSRHAYITNLCQPLAAKLSALKSSMNEQNLPTFSSRNIYNDLKDEIEDCSTKLAVERILATTVHEMLHGSGLHHNMHGSSDEDNYLTAEFIKDVYDTDIEDIPGKDFWPTSSIMDYGNSSTVSTYFPGPYDLAAVRFIQTGRFENLENSLVSVVDVEANEAGEMVTAAKSINQAVAETRVPRKVYETCDDSDIQIGFSVLQGGFRLNEDPMCDFSDIGATPAEKAEAIIRDIKYVKAISVVTRDTRIGSQWGFDKYTRKQIERLREIYSFWRVILSRQMGSPENSYLEEFEDSNEYADFLKSASRNGSPAQQKLFKEYYQARNIIFNFLLDESFTLNHYCVVDYMPVNKSNNQALLREPLKEVVEFSKIKQFIQLSIDDEADVHVGSCLDQISRQALNTYLVSKKSYLVDPQTQGLAIANIEEVGNPLQGYRYSHNRLRSNTGFDTIGFSNYRANSFAAITQRTVTSFEDRASGLYPNMIDEVDLRTIVRARLEDRVNNGVRLNSRGAFGAGLLAPVSEKEDQETFDKVQEVVSSVSQQVAPLLSLGGYSQIGEAFDSYDPMLISSLTPRFKEIAFEGCYNNSDASIIYGGPLNPAYSRFSEEDELVGFYAAMYRSAITVPNDRDASLKRAEQFRVELVSSYQKDYYVRSGADIKFMDLGSYFVYPYEGAAFVKDSIERFDAINESQKAELVDGEKIYELLYKFGRELFTLHAGDEFASPTFTEQRVGGFRNKLDGLFDEVNEAYRRFLLEEEPEEGIQLNESELSIIASLINSKVGGFGTTPIVFIDLDGNPETEETPISYFQSEGFIAQMKSQISRMGELNEYSPDSAAEARARMVNAIEVVSSAVTEYEALTMGDAIKKEAAYNRDNLLKANQEFVCALPEALRGNTDLIKHVSSEREVYKATIFTYEDLRAVVDQNVGRHNSRVLSARTEKEEADAQKNMLRNMISAFLRLQRF